MSRFTEEMKVVPTTARVIAVLAYLGIVCALGATVLYGHDPELAKSPVWAKALLVFAPGIVLAMLVLLIGYVYGDAKRRGMHYVLWTLLAIFVPNAIGIILYFILRDAPPRTCPGCSQIVKAAYAFCPHCSTNLMPACPSCKRGVEFGWKSCAHCGSPLGAVTQPTRLPNASPL
jgi:RNA polymerase subunit RPABC4/transcription elongation factor Spt4